MWTERNYLLVTDVVDVDVLVLDVAVVIMDVVTDPKQAHLNVRYNSISRRVRVWVKNISSRSHALFSYQRNIGVSFLHFREMFAVQL
jgi:YbbR domain-containing protein